MGIKNLFKKAALVGVGISLLFNTAVVSAKDNSTWIKENSNEIKSLTSDNYEDLEFLKPILKDKSVVCLGENFHVVSEYSSMKTRLIKYLHEELDFDVIAFESELSDCTASYEDRENLTPKEMMKNSIFGIWWTKETCDLFDYIKQQGKTDDPLYLSGYDMQPNIGYSTVFIYNLINTIDKNYAKEFFDFDMKYTPSFYSLYGKYGEETFKHKDEVNKIINEYEPKYKKAIKFIDNNKDKLKDNYPDNPHIIDIVKRTLSQRINFVKMILLDTEDSYEFRDKIMTENVEFIMNVLYPGKKVILWAHNDHLAKNTSKILSKENGKWINNFTSMGEMLHKKLKDKEYVLGFYMNRGKTCSISTIFNGQETFNIGPMPEGSLENTIMKSGYDYTFVDLSKHEKENEYNSWMFNPIFASEDGMTSEVIRTMSMMFVPKDQYDGIIVIDKVKTPTFIY